MKIDPTHNHVTLFVTSACQRRCPECSQRGLMAWKPSYQMSIEEVKKFIKVTKQSNYEKFKSIIISGGEPLLWKNLHEGAKLLYKSRLTNKISIFSNGINIQKVDKDLLDSVHVLRVSWYKENQEVLKKLSKKFGSKIVIVDRTKHTSIPDKFYDGVLPAKCLCEGYALCDNRMYACPMIPTVAKEMKVDLKALPNTSIELQPSWVEQFEKFPRTNHKLCRACIGNLKVRVLRGVV